MCAPASRKLAPVCHLTLATFSVRAPGETVTVRVPRADTAVAPEPKALSILSGHEDGSLRLWNADQEAPLRMFDGHAGPVYRVAPASRCERPEARTEWRRQSGRRR